MMRENEGVCWVVCGQSIRAAGENGGADCAAKLQGEAELGGQSTAIHLMNLETKRLVGLIYNCI